MSKNISILGLIIVVAVTIINTLTSLKLLTINNEFLVVSRWLAIILVSLYAIKKKSGLTFWILFSMIIGAEIGLDFPVLGNNLNVLSKIFMKLIKCVIAPLIFGTLVVGIAGHSDMKQVGRMGWKALLYFEVVTTIALAIGLIFINLTKVGVGIIQPDSMKATMPEHKAQNWQEILLHTFPENIAKSIADGQVLQIVVFTILFAMGLTMLSEDKKKPILEFCDSLSEVMFKFTKIIMYVAPFGVGGAMAYTISNMGLDIFKNLIGLVATLYLSLIAFILLVLLPIALYIKLPIRKFIKAITEPVSLAFATASSEAALPSALNNMKKFGVPQKIVSFVLPTGYTFNLDGTTLYLSLASVFVAQAAGINMSISTQMLMVFTLMLTSKGVAGVARASLVILAGTAASFGLPEWPIAAILGVDALMDMARTSVNVIGNSLASVFIAWWEGDLTYQNPNMED